MLLKAPLKRSTLDKETNTQIIFLFIILVSLSFISAVANEILKNNGEDHGSYIGLEAIIFKTQFFLFLTILIVRFLYNINVFKLSKELVPG